MTADELRTFLRQRGPGYSVRHKEVNDLHCYGCAHSAATVPYPGRPSGERPCVTCVRNTEDWAAASEPLSDEQIDALEFVFDDRGNARCFAADAGFAYNGAPYVHWPMDGYVTMDRNDQDQFYVARPDYGAAVRFSGDDRVVVLP